MKKILYIALPLAVIAALLFYGSGAIKNIRRLREEKRRADTLEAKKRIISFYGSVNNLIRLSKNPYFSENFQKKSDDFKRASGGSPEKIVICSEDKPDSYEIKEIDGPAKFSVSARYIGHREQVFFVRVIKSGGEWLIDEVDCLEGD